MSAVVHGRQRSRPVTVALVGAMALVAVIAVGVAVLKQLDQPAPIVDEPFYATTAQLEDMADVIVSVTLVSSRRQTSNGFPEVVATASVDEVAKGAATKGAHIEFAYTEPGAGPETAERLGSGGQFVVLLIAEGGPAPAYLVNTTQGYYLVSNGQANPGPDNPVALSATIRHRLRLG